MKFERRIMRWTGGDDGRVPGDWLAFEFGPEDDGQTMYVARTSNDGLEMFLGYHNKWLFNCRAEDARRLAWWILWRWWVVATWCGLKRRMYYWALSRVVAAWDRQRKVQP